ncbi:MAG: hypothetical protein Q4C03_00910 [bacterium]|nr:hypothetical protein [bacterium]
MSLLYTVHTSFKRLLMLALFCASGGLFAETIAWVVANDVALDVEAATNTLANQTGATVAPVILPSKYLCAWARTPKMDSHPDVANQEEAEALNKALRADHMIVTPSPNEPEGYTFLGLTALAKVRQQNLKHDILLAPIQEPIYQMRGLCDNGYIQAMARLSIGAKTNFVALPKVWQQVYTDDTFYYDRVPKNRQVEAYIFATAVAMKMRDEDFTPQLLKDVHEENATNLIDSIQAGLKLTENVLYAAKFLPRKAFNLRTANAFEAVLYDGDFEHAIGDWLIRFAEADGRTLTLYYTTDTTLDTGVPVLFRTTNPATKASNVTLYTRPAFLDDSAITELSYLPNILDMDGGKEEWLPFQLAVSEWVAQYPLKPVYNGKLPTDTTAAMFASMLYLKWTGAAVMPVNCPQDISAAISVGLEVMLKLRLQRSDINAVFCRPSGKNRYTFSLWRRPSDDVEINLDSEKGRTAVSTRTLHFEPGNFWASQPVEVEGPTTLYWSIPMKNFPGQNTGIRLVP